jgi:hypothetical protein
MRRCSNHGGVRSVTRIATHEQVSLGHFSLSGLRDWIGASLARPVAAKIFPIGPVPH